MHRDHVPSQRQIFTWIEEVFSHGVRRPGYDADRWAERWIEEQFRAIGLERVRAEPVSMPSWTVEHASLTLIGEGESIEVPCFPLPLSAPVDGEFELAVFDRDHPDAVRGRAALFDAPLMRVPHRIMAGLATWHYDPDGTFAEGAHILPFAREFQEVMEPVIDAGARAFIGTLTDYPGDSYQYYVPYDAKSRPIPGVWISGSSGARAREMLARGPVRAALHVRSTTTPITSPNIIGELPGADDETVIIGSHHDGPWSSAVEDASGISLVLAQATYWSHVPREERPHRLVFLLNAGHMAGGAGQAAFVATHRDELDRVVLELHLEHAANEFVQRDGSLVATGEPEARWWFTSRIPALEAAVRAAIEAEDVKRSLIMPPEVFGPKPTTDAADFYPAGVPIVNYLAAPFHLFDAMDTLDKVHRPSLESVTRAAIRIVESTIGVSAATMRAGDLHREGAKDAKI